MADPLPLFTAAVAFALTTLLAWRYALRRKPYQLVWTLSLCLLGVAAFLAFLGNPDVVGWSGAGGALYRLYLPLTAIPVGLIGLGVLQLFRDRPRVAMYYGVYWAATAVLVVLVTALAPLRDPVDGVLLASEGPNVGGRHLPLFGAVSWLQTLPGAVIFVGGGVYTWWRERARYYGLFFALGGILFTVAGFSSRLGAPGMFFVITALATVSMFVGFVLSIEFRASAPSPAKA